MTQAEQAREPANATPSDALPLPCPACGYSLSEPQCPRCHGKINLLGDDDEVRPGSRFPPLDLFHGGTAVFRAGLYLFNRPEFIGLLKLPIAANLVAFAMLFALFWLGFGSLFEWAVGTEWFLLDGLRESLPRSAPLLLTIATAMLLGPTLLEAATGSFFDPLADAVERGMGGPDMRAERTGLWTGMVKGLRDTARILVLQLAMLVPVWLLVLVPVFGLPLVWLVTAALSALVWFEVPCARRGYGLPHRLAVLRANWARALGFGLGFQLGMLVPIFNALLLTPAAAVAASMLYFHFDKETGRG